MIINSKQIKIGFNNKHKVLDNKDVTMELRVLVQHIGQISMHNTVQYYTSVVSRATL